jgi:hypothetical protein
MLKAGDREQGSGAERTRGGSKPGGQAPSAALGTSRSLSYEKADRLQGCWVLLGAFAFRCGAALSAKNGGQGAQRLVHGRTVGKDIQHFRIDHGNVGALSVSRRRNTANGRREVVLRSHGVAPVPPTATASFFLHNASTHLARPAWLRSSECAAAAQQRLPPEAAADWTSRAQDTAARRESDPGPA